MNADAFMDSGIRVNFDSPFFIPLIPSQRWGGLVGNGTKPCKLDGKPGSIPGIKDAFNDWDYHLRF